jgi:hypothetical protein
MRYKLTVLLIVLNLALFSLIFYIDRVQSTRSVFESSSRLILDPSFVQGLDKVRITSTAAGTEWQLEQGEDANWDVVAPIHWKANPYAVQQLLFQLKSLSWESRFPVRDLGEAGQSLESYNLENPPLRIELFNGETSETLLLGAPTEIGNRLYTMSLDGKFVLVISRGLMEMLQRDMDAFLDRRIFGISMEESRIIQIQDRAASNVRVRLERAEAGWEFVSPIEAEADGERVQAMISDWQSTDAEGFDVNETAGLEMDSNAIQLTFEGLNSRETLVLAPPAGEPEATYYLAKRDVYDSVFKVNALQVDELRKAQEALREKRVLNRHAEDWTSLEIQFGDLTTILQQLETGDWQVLSTDESGALKSHPADLGEVDQIKELLRTMEAVRFVSDAPSENDLIRFGLDEPQRTITLRTASGQAVVFTIGGVSREDESTLLYATTDQSGSVFVIRPHILAKFPLNPLHYRDRTLFRLPESTTVTAVLLTDAASGDPLPLDEALESALGSYISEVKVNRFLDKPFADPIPLGEDRQVDWPYRLIALVAYPSPATEGPDTYEFHISIRLGGTIQYIGDPQSGLVGTLPIDLIEALDPILATFPEDPGEAPDDPEFMEEPAPAPEAEPPAETEPQT